MKNSAQTRFDNDKIRAAQNQLVGNLSAQNSMRPTGGPVRKQPPGANFNPIVDRDVSQVVPTQPKPLRGAIPPGFNPIYSQKEAAQPSVEPDHTSDDPLEGLLRAIHTQKLVDLPETAAAYTKFKLRDHFHGRPSPNIGREVLETLRSQIRD